MKKKRAGVRFSKIDARFLKTDIRNPNTYLCFQMDIYFLVKDS